MIHGLVFGRAPSGFRLCIVDRHVHFVYMCVGARARECCWQTLGFTQKGLGHRAFGAQASMHMVQPSLGVEVLPLRLWPGLLGLFPVFVGCAGFPRGRLAHRCLI